MDSRRCSAPSGDSRPRKDSPGSICPATGGIPVRRCWQVPCPCSGPATSGGCQCRSADRLDPDAPQRRAAGLLLALAGVPLLTVVFTQFRDAVGLPTVLLGFLALVVAAVTAFLAANWYFTPPYHQWTIAEGENVLVPVGDKAG